MLELLISFLYVGLFSIGGGYATLPLIQEQIVELHGWLSYKDCVCRLGDRAVVLVCCQFVASDQRRAGPQGRRYQSGGIAAIEKISYESGLGHVRLRRGGLFPLLARGEPGKAFPAGRLY